MILLSFRDQRDRFAYVGERFLNAFVTIVKLASGIGCLFFIGKYAVGGSFGVEKQPPKILIYSFLCGALFLFCRWFSIWLERKHLELKEIVRGLNIANGDLYRMAQDGMEDGYIPVPVKRGSLHPMEELESLIGLESVKHTVNKIRSVYLFEQANPETTKNKDKKKNIARHYAFIGNPGTGKTTVARIFCGLLYENKQLKRNIFVECTGNDLISEFSGDTKNRVAKLWIKAKKGVLFIDEAYVLNQSERAHEALAQLLTLMEGDTDTVVIFAGYEAEMADFLLMNSGLASRISHKLYFEDYTSEELFQIFYGFCQSKNIIVGNRAKDRLIEIFDAKKHTPSNIPFSNGRYARNCFDIIYQQHALHAALGKPWVQQGMILEDDIIPITEELLALD